eukprot:Phypoly_transcript_16101.p1 GENE.Phypoly_transcript_16101~~Phypoly_transcript_16101.p1  ORF type:complete len:166 (+),score=14.05 Phypoly_transcript_16101:238-735(+)
MSIRRKVDSYQTIGDDQVSEFKEAFELFDSERTGFITKEGLQTVLKQFGVRVEPAAFNEMFNEADATGNGKIQFPEFLSMMGRRMKQTTSEDILRQAFRTFDPEGTGYIPKAALQDALLNLGDRLKPHEFAEFLGITETEKGQIRKCARFERAIQLRKLVENFLT